MGGGILANLHTYTLALGLTVTKFGTVGQVGRTVFLGCLPRSHPKGRRFIAPKLFGLLFIPAPFHLERPNTAR